MSHKSLAMLIIFSFLLLATMTFTITSHTAYAQEASTVDIRIKHLITINDGGMVIINDTVTLTKKAGQQPAAFSSFELGFPIAFRAYIYQVWAYQGQNPQQRLQLGLDTGLGKEGFYAVTVHFSNPVDLNSVNSFDFSVIYELSNLITENLLGSTYAYYLPFPVFPSLSQEVVSCNSTVVLPEKTTFSSSSPTFNATSLHTFTLMEEPLPAFTFEGGRMQFTGSSFNLLDIREVSREVTLSDLSTLFVTDSYAATNLKSEAASTILASLPADAYNIKAEDDIGNTLTFTNTTAGNTIKATITLKAPVQHDQTAYILVSFNLPLKNYVTPNGWNNYSLKFKLFEPINVTLRQLTVKINLPEGSKYQFSNSAFPVNLDQDGIYSQTPVYMVSNISRSQNLDVEVGFQYVVFWSSFRPTLWMGALVTVVGVVALLWQAIRSAAPTTVTVHTTLTIRPEELRNYVKTYEEQMKLQHERENLEAQARKGKIPRRLYRVRSRTIESRLTLLSRDLDALRDKLRAAGPRYSDMMRQIENAQTELQTIETDIERIEARYKRGEISAVDYHKQLEDFYKRRERAQTNIDGVLLRLREEAG